MELDFGPADPPVQPPSNPPPDTPPPAGPPSAPVEPKVTPTPTPPVSPKEPPDLPKASAPAPSKPKSRKAFLVVGTLIILAGLGYLGYTFFFAVKTPSQSQNTEDTDLTTDLTSTLTPTSTLAPTPTSTPLGSTPAASETVGTRDAIRKKDLATIQTYLESYFNDNASYPRSANFAKLNDSTNAVVTALVPKYTSSLPRDPKGPSFFYGYKSADGLGYTLTAQLENSNDSEGKLEGSVYLYKVTK